MIARFRVLLPFFFYIREGDALPPFEVTRNNCRVKFFPPIHSGISPDELEGDSPITQVQIFERIKNPPAPTYAGLVQVDGARTARANMLQLEIQKESFNRRQDSIGNPNNEEVILQSGDPPLREVFDLFNDYIARLRLLHRASFAHPISPLDAFWCIQYFADDGSELTPDPALFRVRSGGRVRFQLFGITPAVWDEFKSMPPTFNTSPWVVLLLDAGDLLPDLGASIAVANASLEIFSSWFSNEFARRSPVPAELWKWINDRGDWYKEPSVAERFDELLEIFTGHSLKEEPVLWNGFKNLRSARNNFAHEGIVAIGPSKASVNTIKARELINNAHAIVAWVEKMLPPELNTPKTKVTVEMQATKLIAQV